MTRQSKSRRLSRAVQIVDKEEESDKPLLYYRTMEEIRAYRKKPVKLKMQWLEAQMEFFYKAMPQKAKRIRERINKGNF